MELIAGGDIHLAYFSVMRIRPDLVIECVSSCMGPGEGGSHELLLIRNMMLIEDGREAESLMVDFGGEVASKVMLCLPTIPDFLLPDVVGNMHMNAYAECDANRCMCMFNYELT